MDRIRRASALMAAGALALLTACATNTMTGRTQMNLISDEAVSKQSLSYYSAMVGDYLYRPAAAQWDWRVTIIDDPETVNAFCMPSGLMGLYTGLMEKLNASDDEIAQAMDHEIGHVLAFVNRSNNRLTEHEADRIGIELVARAGYDPAAVPGQDGPAERQAHI